jgi:ribosomal protein S27E
MTENKIKKFWRSKAVKCDKCKSENMIYNVKIYGVCGFCGKELKQSLGGGK